MATATRKAPQIGLIRLSDLPDGDGFHRSWVMVLPEGEYQHDEFGPIDLTRPVLDEMIRNFEEKARGIDIALDYDHQAPKGDSKAPGWIEALQYRPAQGETPAGLWARVRWTEIGLHDVKSQIYRYLSAEFKPTYKNDITGKTFKNVLVGLTLTNRPYMKHMPAIVLSKFERPGHYTDKDRKKIDESDFAGPGRTFPIVTQQDVHDAARLIGHAANPAAVKARIKAIAKRKGFSLPKEWEAESSSSGSGDGGKGMAERDLNDLSLYEDEAESARYELADKGSGKGSGGKGMASTMKAKMQAPAYDNDADDDELAENDDDADMMDDGEDDAESYDDRDADSGDEDIDHLPGDQKNRRKAKGKGGAAKMSERDEDGPITLEEARAMRRELAELRQAKYRSDAEVILKGFESGSFQFSSVDAKTRSKSGQPLGTSEVTRSGQFKLAPKAQRAVREWLLSDAAYTLSEGERTQVLGLIEQVIRGVVDLSVRGSSHDMEREKTVTLKSPSERAVSKVKTLDELRLETARELALAEGKNFDALRSLQAERSREGIQAARDVERIYLLADKQIAAE